MKNTFRYIVAVSTVLFILLWCLPYFSYLWLTQEELQLAALSGYGRSFPNHPMIYWILFSAWLALSIGLFFFIRLARVGFLVMTVLFSIINFFNGFSIMPPLDLGISNIVTLADGAILTMAYLTPVANNFRRKEA